MNIRVPIIWLLHHYGGPPDSGRFARASALGRVLARTGFRVRVFYASNHHLNPEVGIGTSLEQDGVEYVAISCRPYRGNGLARILNMRDFAHGIIREAKRCSMADAPDVVVASLPHPWVASAALRVKKRFGTKFVLEIRDIWPESLMQLAGVSPYHPFVVWVRYLIGRAYRHCDGVVSVLPEALGYFRERVGRERNIPMAVVPNGTWISEPSFEKSSELDDIHREAIQAARDAGEVVIGYTGAMGPPNALQSLIDLQSWWNARGEKAPYRFLLVGEGPQREELEKVAAQAPYPIFDVLPRLKKSMVREFLNQVDAGFIAWNSVPLYRYGVSPNKIWDYFLARRPVLWAGNVGANPVEQSGAGLVCLTTDPESLHELCIRFMELDPSEYEAMGDRGTKYLREHGDWDLLGRKFGNFLSELMLERE